MECIPRIIGIGWAYILLGTAGQVVKFVLSNETGFGIDLPEVVLQMGRCAVAHVLATSGRLRCIALLLNRVPGTRSSMPLDVA